MDSEAQGSVTAGDFNATPARRPAIAVSSTSLASKSASSSGAMRSDSFSAATPSSPAARPRRQHAHRDRWLHRRRKHLGFDAALELFDHALLGFARKGEPLVFLADSRDRPVEEHQREVLRVLAAELVDAPENRADSLKRIERGQVIASVAR